LYFFCHHAGPVFVPDRNDVFADHHKHSAHFVSIQAGLFSGLAGHQVKVPNAAHA
jgi:hypothetical protein